MRRPCCKPSSPFASAEVRALKLYARYRRQNPGCKEYACLLWLVRHKFIGAERLLRALVIQYVEASSTATARSYSWRDAEYNGFIGPLLHEAADDAIRACLADEPLTPVIQRHIRTIRRKVRAHS